MSRVRTISRGPRSDRFPRPQASGGAHCVPGLPLRPRFRTQVDAADLAGDGLGQGGAELDLAIIVTFARVVGAVSEFVIVSAK
jgi:hypothetical protein